MLRILALLFALCGWMPLGWAQGLQPVPELTARVIDQTGKLDAIQRKGLEDKLAAFEQEKGSQIVILLVPSTQPEDIASYANRVANSWKIGRKAVGDGILLIVAVNDRKIRIEVAKTLEGAVPDLAAKQVIDEAIAPRFRVDDYAGGLQGAVDQLIARVKGEALPGPTHAPPSSSDGPGFGIDWVDFGLFFFFGVAIAGAVLRNMLGRKLGSLVAGSGFGVVALVMTSSMVVAGIAGVLALLYTLLSGGSSVATPSARPGRKARRSRGGGWSDWSSGSGSGGGWSSGGSDGGGFSSGGGGDFGGGGSSGDW